MKFRIIASIIVIVAVLAAVVIGKTMSNRDYSDTGSSTTPSEFSDDALKSLRQQ